MNPKVKKLWVEALRSGKYKQFRGRLRSSNNSFCVLGVLCNLHAEAHPEIAATQTNMSVYLGQSHDLPGAVEDWSGFNPLAFLNGGTRRYPYYARLITMNDEWKYSFERLADIIEAYA